MTTWHAPEDVLARYARDPEALDAATGSSVELHVAACETCRSVVARHADAAVLDQSWRAVAERIDAPRPSVVERILRLAGVDETWARLVAVTPALRLSWFASLAVLVTAVAGLARDVEGAGLFLVVAPLVPLAAVALAFLPDTEPAGEAGRAAPLVGLPLALRRAVAVLVPTVALLAAGSLAVPGLQPIDAAWLLPGLALAAGVLALSTWLRAETATVVLAAAWLGAVGTLHVATRAQTADLPLFAAGAQLAWVAALAGCVVLVAARSDSFARSRRSS